MNIQNRVLNLVHDLYSQLFAICVYIKLTSETSTFTAAKTAIVKFLKEGFSKESPYLSSTNL